MSMHTNIFDVTNYAQLDLKQIYFYTILNLMRPRCQSVINVNNTQCDTRNGTQGGTQDRLQKLIFDTAV